MNAVSTTLSRYFRLRASAARRSGLRGWLPAWCVACCLIAFAARGAHAQPGGDGGVINREYPLKALFLYNFGSYVEWPEGTFAHAGSPFVIGVIGRTPLDATLQQIAATKKINDRPIIIKQFASAEEVTPCQILFVARGLPAKEQQSLIASLKERATLLVGETAGFATAGACVNFFVQDNKIRFEINLDATRERRLKVSSKLLSMAKIIETTPADQLER